MLLTKRIAAWPRSFLLVSKAHNLSWQLKMIVLPSVAMNSPGVPKFSVVILEILVGLLNEVQRIWFGLGALAADAASQVAKTPDVVFARATSKPKIKASSVDISRV